MTKTDPQKTATIPTDLIAPCGMNCRLCWGYVRDKNACPGCLRNDGQQSKKSQYRSTCKIRSCEEITQGKTKYCSQKCDQFPCARLKQLDQRYRTRYGMSVIENLQMINAEGIRRFIRHEKAKWTCPDCGDMICVHKPKCLACGYSWRRDQITR